MRASGNICGDLLTNNTMLFKSSNKYQDNLKIP